MRTDVAFYTVDSDLRIVSITPATLRIWGKTSREVVGRKLTDIFPQMPGTEIHEALLEALRTLRPGRLQAHSPGLGGVADVEIYPLGGQLQVRYSARPALKAGPSELARPGKQVSGTS